MPQSPMGGESPGNPFSSGAFLNPTETTVMNCQVFELRKARYEAICAVKSVSIVVNLYQLNTPVIGRRVN
jgi:hypothetical protein